MSMKDLQDFLNSTTPDERLERQALKAWMTVLRHKAFIDAKDIDALAEIAANTNPKEERNRVRAAEMLNAARQKAAEALANATAIREEVMEAKGLKAGGPQLQVFNFEGMDLEKLKALAEGKPLTPPEKVVEAEVVKPEGDPRG